jgi:hypothetical protein
LISAGIGVAVLAVALVLGLTLGSTGSKPSQRHTVATQPFEPGGGVHLQGVPPPWPLPADARPYIAAAGLPVLGQEASAVHYHAHLDITVNGQAVAVPAQVGFVIENGTPVGITALHTHDASAVIHIESAVDRPYTLGQFFTEWGVPLGSGQLGGLRDTATDTLRTFVGGQAFTGDPATIVLRPHQEIALWYGSRQATPHVPASYQFPQGE